jgi:hypothetical protein
MMAAARSGDLRSARTAYRGLTIGRVISPGSSLSALGAALPRGNPSSVERAASTLYRCGLARAIAMVQVIGGREAWRRRIGHVWLSKQYGRTVRPSTHDLGGIAVERTIRVTGSPFPSYKPAPSD